MLYLSPRINVQWQQPCHFQVLYGCLNGMHGCSDKELISMSNGVWPVEILPQCRMDLFFWAASTMFEYSVAVFFFFFSSVLLSFYLLVSQQFMFLRIHHTCVFLDNYSFTIWTCSAWFLLDSIGWYSIQSTIIFVDWLPNLSS